MKIHTQTHVYTLNNLFNLRVRVFNVESMDVRRQGAAVSQMGMKNSLSYIKPRCQTNL